MKSIAFVFFTVSLLFALFTGCSSSEQTDTAGDQPDPISFTMTGEDSVSVFSILKRHHKTGHKESAMGVFVTSIEGINNADSGYWTYTVNGTAPQVAADKYMTSDGDTVVWIYQPINR